MLPSSSTPFADAGYATVANGASPTLEQAILWTVAYADIFEYPLTAAEIHRYLVGLSAPLERVQEGLRGSPLLSHHLSESDGYYTLAGREHALQARQRRAAVAAQLWPRALRYGRAIARLPFVRMVAVTGALAVDNVEPSADIDYLIVTEPGRLWLCRALVIALVRMARWQGDIVCPNYFLSERALVIPQRNLFTARELAQMVPLVGLATYQQMRRLNEWSASYLPNAQGSPRPVAPDSPHPIRALAELTLRNPLGRNLDRWEMARKVRKFSHYPKNHTEAAFSADWCKGHFDGHGSRILDAFNERRRLLDAQVGAAAYQHGTD